MNPANIFCGICGKAEPVCLLQHVRDEYSLTPEAYRQRCPNAPLFTPEFGEYLKTNRIHIADGTVKTVRELLGVETTCNAVVREHVPTQDDTLEWLVKQKINKKIRDMRLRTPLEQVEYARWL